MAIGSLVANANGQLGATTITFFPLSNLIQKMADDDDNCEAEAVAADTTRASKWDDMTVSKY